MRNFMVGILMALFVLTCASCGSLKAVSCEAGSAIASAAAGLFCTVKEVSDATSQDESAEVGEAVSKDGVQDASP